MIKLLLYLFVTLIVVFAMDSININAIFKKGKVVQARIFYFILALVIIYILVSLIYDISGISKIF